MGWAPDPTFVIRTDPLKGASYPFPHSPPGSPHPEEDREPRSEGQTPTPGTPTQREEGTGGTHNSRSPTHGGTRLSPSWSTDTPSDTTLTPVVDSTHTSLKFLTINAQKAGPNSPSLSDIVTILDEHNPDVLFLTETPQHSRSGALAQVLRNRGFHIHYHPANAPSTPETLPEARTPAHLTQAGGGTWLAYRKDAPWSSMVHTLPLPEDCPSNTTCAVELTLLTCAKAAFISCYLPQSLEAHAEVCKALATLTKTLPHHVLIMGGDLQGDWDNTSPKTPHITSLPFVRWKGPKTPTFLPRQQPLQASCIDHLTLWDPNHITHQIGDT